MKYNEIRLWSYHSPIIVLNNRDFNIGQNNRDYDFCHNRAALVATPSSSKLSGMLRRWNWSGRLFIKQKKW